MKLPIGWSLAILTLNCFAAADIDVGGRLPAEGTDVTLWWALSSAAKIRPDTAPPDHSSPVIQIRCARNETECVQIVLRPGKPLHQLTINADTLTGPGQQSISTKDLEILEAAYVQVSKPSDKSTESGFWPDPLLPVTAPRELSAGINQAFWLRVHIGRDIPPGPYHGRLRLKSKEWHAEVPLELTVYGFTLPDQMTCQTAFGFSSGEVFRYEHVKDEQARRQVLAQYWADLAAHHISPYDPAPLDPFKVTWPKIEPPKAPANRWTNLRIVQNESHSGKGALLVYDDKPKENVVVSYEPLIPIPAKGLHLRGWYRTAVPGHRFTISLNHYDTNQQWLSGRNKDFTLGGNGKWQNLDRVLTEFPAGAKFVRLNLMATVWTDSGENLGLVWYDDISIQDIGTGEELVVGGDFEPKQRTELVAPAEQLHPSFDFTAWDAAMSTAFDRYHFNSFSVPIPGLGGGTFHELLQPNLQGFGEDAPEYPLLLGSYCRQIQTHLREKGWLDRAFIYWFDEPNEDQYPYLQNGFNKLKEFCPDITRMITKHVEPGLIGGPNLWCPISDQYNHERAQERRKLGERFWWYVCTGPKAPYTGLFLDHPAPEMRIWLWQTFQRNINGILVWQCNYWNSPTAYPEDGKPQNPYADPMSWMTGYGTASGKRIAWGNGDGRFIYPPPESVTGSGPVLSGPVDSIRWEQLRDGIEDYEYLTILKHKLDQRRASLSPEKQKEYEQLLEVPANITRSLTEFTRDGAPIELRRDQIARAIEGL